MTSLTEKVVKCFWRCDTLRVEQELYEAIARAKTRAGRLENLRHIGAIAERPIEQRQDVFLIGADVADIDGISEVEHRALDEIAGALQVDTSRLALNGASAGGNLALAAAYTRKAPRPGCGPALPPVAAVVARVPLVDPAASWDHGGEMQQVQRRLMRAYFGGSPAERAIGVEALIASPRRSG